MENFQNAADINKFMKNYVRWNTEEKVYVINQIRKDAEAKKNNGLGLKMKVRLISSIDVLTRDNKIHLKINRKREQEFERRYVNRRLRYLQETQKRDSAKCEGFLKRFTNTMKDLQSEFLLKIHSCRMQAAHVFYGNLMKSEGVAPIHEQHPLFSGEIMTIEDCDSLTRGNMQGIVEVVATEVVGGEEPGEYVADDEYEWD